MEKKNIILIGIASPPLGGEALSFLMFKEHLLLSKNVKVILIDKLFKQSDSRIRRVANPIRVILLTLFLVFTKKISGLYLTCGQSKGGVIRDGIVITICHLFSIPMVIHLHGGGVKNVYDTGGVCVQAWMKFIYQKPKCIIVLGESLREQFYFLADQQHINIIVNSYFSDTPVIDDFDSRYDELKKHKKLKLLYLSHVLPSKGLFDVLDALIILNQEDIPFEFHFAGEIISEGKYSRQKIEEKIQWYQQKLGSQQFVIHGFIEAKQKWQLIIKTNVFLLPTKFYAEGQPISIIEALYAGNCIITTRYRGIPELVLDDCNGWFVESGDPVAIADRLKWLRDNPESMKKISIANHVQATQKFSPKRFLEQMTHTVNIALDLAIMEKG